jgi:eukaryotic-like serine/threonine-protein kinase
MSRDDENERTPAVDPADLETRVVLEDDSFEDEGESAGSNDQDPHPGHGSDAPTVLAEEDDRTQLVTRDSATDPVDSLATAETRVLDETEAKSRLSAPDVVAETRVLDAPDVPENKTAPPPVSSSSAPGDPDRGLEPGMVLFGEYEIVNVLGVGGMGEVYRARHRRLDEFRAIKVMHADLSKKKGAAEFFYREAKALLAVRHPAVVHCHDLLSDDAGRVYLVMEMIEGIPLSKKMNDGPLSADDVAILGARVSHGLSAAHRKGVIHRDVSPDNIVLPNGRVQEAKIIDFGIAKILEEGEGTIVDGFKGKLSYASPEQLGFFGGKLDGRSDFYSLGLVLVAAAIGRPMGMGTTVMEAVDARRGFEALPDEIPMGLRSAIEPLLALDPKDRPKYVDRLFVVPGGVEGAHTGSYATPSRSARSEDPVPARSRTGMIAGAVAAGLIALGGGGYWWSTSSSSAPRSEGTANAAAVQEARVTAPIEPTEPVAVVEVPTETPAPTAVVEEVAEPVVVAKVEKAPAPKPPRRLTASDRIKIIGLINNAKLAMGENRLMSPPGDNAYDRYQRVLKLDPKNSKAKDGLRAVAGRYLALAETAHRQGNSAQTRDFLAKARKADASHPKLDATEARLAE